MAKNVTLNYPERCHRLKSGVKSGKIKPPVLPNPPVPHHCHKMMKTGLDRRLISVQECNELPPPPDTTFENPKRRLTKGESKIVVTFELFGYYAKAGKQQTLCPNGPRSPCPHHVKAAGRNQNFAAIDLVLPLSLLFRPRIRQVP